MDEIFRDRSVPIEFCPLIEKPAVSSMDTLFGSKIGEYMRFCLVITDTGLLEANSGKTKK